MFYFGTVYLQVAKAINSLTVDTPLFKCAGDIPANAVGTTDGGSAAGGEESTAANKTTSDVVAYNSNPTSYAAIHLQLHKKNKLYAEKYTEHILTYATEWERILSTRITGHLKQSEKLRVDLDHYGGKVEELNKSMNKTMSKGKSISDSGVDKVKRNEQKLIQARQEYDRFVNDLCGFMEEVMDRGWKDLHPLLVKMAQFDSTLSNEESMLLKGSMAAVTEQMKGMGSKYPNLKPTGRLKELETWSLESLNKVNPSLRSDSPLMITQGGGEAASYVTGVGETGGNVSGIHAGIGGRSNDQLDAGGLFGTSNTQISRTSSFASGAGSDHGGQFGAQPRSRNDTGDSYDWTTGMPTDRMSSSSLNAGGSVNHSSSFRAIAPSSGGLPPLNPNNRQGSFHGASDMSATSAATSAMLTTMQAAAPPPTMDDIFGGGSTAGNMPPPPAGMPPPPPSMPPPPVPQSLSPQVSALSLYDNGGSGRSLQGHHQVPPYPPVHQGSPFMSPTAQSVTSASTNPFDGPFGAAPAPGTMAPQAPVPQYGGAPQQTNPFGSSGASASTNPFG